MEGTFTHIQSLNYSSHSHLITRMMLLLTSTLATAQHIYMNYKISMNRVRTLKYSLEGYMFALLSALSLLLVCLFIFFHISNGMSLMSTLYAYSLQHVRINQHCE